MRQQIETFCEENDLQLLFMDGHDNAILGIASKFHDFSVVYSKKKIIENLCKDMSFDEALEFYEFNISGAYVGESTPIIMDDMLNEFLVSCHTAH